MNVAVEHRAGPMRLLAPVAGRVRIHPPDALRGELEVFDPGETIADVDGKESVDAPGHGFVVRYLVSDGARVEAGSPILIFSVVGRAMPR